MNEDSRKLDEMLSFDKILLDAPCSGSGTLDLQKENSNFNKELIQRSTILQEKLLRKALKLTKPGCEIIYSTCSILKNENEGIIKKLLDENKVEIVPINLTGDFEKLPVLIDGTLCIAPNEYYEGFFVAKLKKI